MKQSEALSSLAYALREQQKRNELRAVVETGRDYRPQKGDVVEVVRGRLVKKGTVGIVKWVSVYHPEKAWYLSQIRVGLKVEGSEQLVYTYAHNCQLVVSSVKPDAMVELVTDNYMHKLVNEYWTPEQLAAQIVQTCEFHQKDIKTKYPELVEQAHHDIDIRV